jgi:hypothetical protein
MFSVAIRYAMAKEESGHTDQPSSSKGHDKKRKVDCSVNAVERL